MADMTKQQSQIDEEMRFLRLAFSDGTPRTALLTALVVGTILIVINQIDVFAAGTWPPLWKVALTYFVPYVVTTYGAVKAKQALGKADKR